MRTPYTKPFSDIATNVETLAARGMCIPDVDHATRSLRRIGYYRLSAYWYPFRSFVPDANDPTRRVRGEQFREGTSFNEVMTFYLFDKAMRSRLADALERIEIAVRAILVETLGALSPSAHRDPRSYTASFTAPDENGETKFDPFLAGLDASFARSKAEFAKHFRTKYDGHPPIWIAAEAWDWGNLTYTLSFLSDQNKDSICHAIHPDLKRKTLVSWMTCLNDVRNACAHHSRLWNRPLINSPSLKQPELTVFDDLRDEKGRVPDAQAKRLYGALAITVYLLRRFHPRTTWHLRLIDLIAKVQLPREIQLDAAGFPTDWRQHTIWSPGSIGG